MGKYVWVSKVAEVVAASKSINNVDSRPIKRQLSALHCSVSIVGEFESEKKIYESKRTGD